jgi:putative ABC transport system permease protein
MPTNFRADLRYAVRTLIRNRGFAATALVTLALGIGANTAIFSVLRAVLLRPQPYHESGRLVFLWSTSQAGQLEPLTPGRLIDFREEMSSFAALAGISHIPLNLTGQGEPERISGSSVSSTFFDVLGVKPLIGEPFHSGTADERGVVLSHGLWTRRFAADRAIIGRSITLNGAARTVMAVMGPEFDWPAVTASPGHLPGPELWIPGTVRDIPRMPREGETNPAADRTTGYLRAIARLQDYVSTGQARLEAQAVAVRLGERHPREDGGRGAALVPLQEQFVGHVRQPIFVLLGAVGFVLAIACANIASLLLGRAEARRTELAVRLALGASRGRIVCQVLTESMVLAMASAAVGVVVAWWALHGLALAGPAGVAGLERAVIDGRVLAFAILLAIATGVLCGIVPALHSSATILNADLTEGSSRTAGARRSSRTRDVLVAMEVAVALVLLVGAGLLLRSFHSLSRIETGIDTGNLLTFNLFLTAERAQSPSRQRAFYEETLRAVAALPGVVRAGAAVTLPIGGDDFSSTVAIEGQPAPPAGQEPRAGYQVVTPGYFETMGIPIREGRDFTPSDDVDAPPVVMVNETFARQHLSGRSPIGRRLRAGGGSGGWMTVVGLVSDVRHLGPARPPRPEFYQPYTQRSFSFMAFVVRTRGIPASLVAPIRAAVARLDPSQPISGVSTMDQHLAAALSRPRFLSTLVATFGLLALLLSVVGVYGVMAYSVSQRTREIAIRSALGATSARIVGTVISKALWLTLAGAAAGVAASLALSRVLGGLLFETEATDPATYGAVVVTLMSTALLAAALPALRATRIPRTGLLRG